MASWGRQQQRQQGDTYYRQGSWTKFQNRKPPHEHDSRQFDVPAWEKNFCTSVGSVPWKKLLDTKSFIYLYKDVVQWNDSAGEEAFRNAKGRFWAKINGLPCDISLPDPDIHIDEIDWDSGVDPELVSDLEKGAHLSDDEGDVERDLLLLNLPIIPTGWGDDDEDFKRETTGRKADDKENPWEPVFDQMPEAVGGWGSTTFGESNTNMERPTRADRVDWGNTDARTYGMNDSGARRYNSGYRTSRFQGDYYRQNRDQGYWRNGGRRHRVNAGYYRSSAWNNCQQV